MARTKLKTNDLFHHDVCPACGSSSFVRSESIQFHGRTLDYDRCTECNLMFMNPMPHQQWYNRFYGKQFWEEKAKQVGENEVRRNELQWIKELRLGEKYLSCISKAGLSLPKGGRFLEIGCAYGLIIRVMADHFSGRALGVEPSEAARSFAERYAEVEIVAGNVDELAGWATKNSVGLVVMSTVLENIVNPLDALRTVRDALEPNGVLLIETPMPYFRKCISIYHPYVFTYAALSRYLGKAGFEVQFAKYSGRPKSLVIPRHLTVLARPIKENGGIEGQFPARVPGFAQLRRLGLATKWIFDITIGPFDLWMAKKAYPLSKENFELIEKLRRACTDDG